MSLCDHGRTFAPVGRRRAPDRFCPQVYQDLSEGFNLYSSTDLATWEHHGYAILNTSMPCSEARGPYRIERPKIMKNPTTGSFVMVCVPAELATAGA
jgi:hypothetical protein